MDFAERYNLIKKARMAATGHRMPCRVAAVNPAHQPPVNDSIPFFVYPLAGIAIALTVILDIALNLSGSSSINLGFQAIRKARIE